jgi:hypothetical protein
MIERSVLRAGLVAWGVFLSALVASPAAAQSDEQDVMAVVQRLADGMRTRDSLMMRDVFEPGARLTGMRTRRSDGAAIVQSLPAADFIAFVLRDPRTPWIERLWQPEVRINGTLATVWAEYDFHFGQKFSHCGIDAFQLLKTANGWKIVALADTYQPEGCVRHPPPDAN